jgi:hypothetical protein
MSVPPSELARFHEFIGERLSQGDHELTPEEALNRFRSQLVDNAELAESVAALQRALGQADRGEGMPLDEAMQRLREEFDLPRVPVEK